jgi:hypothetical protein
MILTMRNQILTIILSAAFLAAFCTPLQAQVVIGADTVPNSSATLEIRSNGTRGLLLPRVVLTDTIVAAPFIEHVKGMFVYNTTASSDGKVQEGIYYNDGDRWWKTFDDHDVIGGGSIEPWFEINTSTAAALNTQKIYQSGKVGVGAGYVSGVDTVRMSMLEVDGASTNRQASANTAYSINFTESNLAYTTVPAGTFALNGLKDGGTYTLAVQGVASGTATFSQSGMTFHYVNNGATAAGKHTLYTFIVMGSDVYVWMTPGFVEQP